jgi:hypothetical protein
MLIVLSIVGVDARAVPFDPRSTIAQIVARHAPQSRPYIAVVDGKLRSTDTEVNDSDFGCITIYPSEAAVMFRPGYRTRESDIETFPPLDPFRSPRGEGLTEYAPDPKRAAR